MHKEILKLLVGMPVRTNKRLLWHGLDIPKDAYGYIKSVSGDGGAVVVKFMHGKYGCFEMFTREIRPA
jgi:hypothetical protein